MHRRAWAIASPHDPAFAALLLAGLLLLLAMPDPRLVFASCDVPGEAAALDGVTTLVRCGRRADAPAPLRGPARLLFGGRIDLNAASASTLQVLPGIGPRRAAAIVEAREARRFVRAGDLVRVAGIGPRTIERLSEWVEVESEGRSAD